MDTGQIALLFAVLVLIVMSGFFSAAEMAYSTVNKIRLMNFESNGNKRAGRVLKMLSDYDRLLSTILIGNNIVNITTATLSTLLFTSFLVHRPDLAATLSTVVTTAVVLIFGEITPKSFAKEKPENMVMSFYPMLRFFQIILYPLNFIFVGWKLLLKKLFHFERAATFTEDELITIVEAAESEGELEQHESQLIRSAIEFEDLDVGDVMVPRVNVVAISENADMESIYRKFNDFGYSRMPVYSETIDSIIGIIHEKDFYALLHDNVTGIGTIIQNTVCVSDSMKISTVLRMLQKAKMHMAIVVDEFGGTAGIVTLEDILEELVGEIYDEHDEVEEPFRKVDEDVYLVSGSANFEDLMERLDMREQPDVDSTTVGGFVTEQLDRIPQKGESLIYENIAFEVTAANAKQVQEVKVTVLPDEEEKEDKKERDDRK